MNAFHVTITTICNVLLTVIHGIPQIVHVCTIMIPVATLYIMNIFIGTTTIIGGVNAPVVMKHAENMDGGKLTTIGEREIRIVVNGIGHTTTTVAGKIVLAQIIALTGVGAIKQCDQKAM